MQKYSIAILVVLVLLVLVDYIEFQDDTILQKLKDNQEVRYIGVFILSGFVLYTEYNNKNIGKPPSYEESISTF